jgi:hypothetical protein
MSKAADVYRWAGGDCGRRAWPGPRDWARKRSRLQGRMGGGLQAPRMGALGPLERTLQGVHGAGGARGAAEEGGWGTPGGGGGHLTPLCSQPLPFSPLMRGQAPLSQHPPPHPRPSTRPRPRPRPSPIPPHPTPPHPTPALASCSGSCTLAAAPSQVGPGARHPAPPCALPAPRRARRGVEVGVRRDPAAGRGGWAPHNPHSAPKGVGHPFGWE